MQSLLSSFFKKQSYFHFLLVSVLIIKTFQDNLSSLFVTSKTSLKVSSEPPVKIIFSAYYLKTTHERVGISDNPVSKMILAVNRNRIKTKRSLNDDSFYYHISFNSGFSHIQICTHIPLIKNQQSNKSADF